jgi:hypothetical protein
MSIDNQALGDLVLGDLQRMEILLASRPRAPILLEDGTIFKPAGLEQRKSLKASSGGSTQCASMHRVIYTLATTLRVQYPFGR